MENEEQVVNAIVQEPFDADAFVERLIEEAANIPCDETETSFQHNDLPPFYDEKKFRRGQEFFHKYIFSHFFCCMLGLMTVLTVPSILRILMHTRMSGSSMTAYRRYLSTVFHMMTWYDYDFKPGSRMWQSIADVKSRHNSASKKGCAAGLSRINQKDMAITQFGFLGYAIIRTKLIGIHGATEQELHDFIHVWRVIGYIMGLQDKYNICRDSVEETRQICEAMVQKIFKPSLEKRDEDFLDMSKYLAEGMWTVNPFLSHKVLLCYVYNLMTVEKEVNNNGRRRQQFVELDFWERVLLDIFYGTMYFLQYNLFRLHQNFMQYAALWLMKVFPFLAYYQFGYKNSHVTILNGLKSD